MDASAPPVYFVEIADLDSDELVVPRVAAALGLTAEPGRDTGDTLLDTVRSRPMLLVLDNCEHLVEECARLCTALLAAGGDGLRVLATSREPLRVSGEAVWRVPPMSLTAETIGPAAFGEPAPGADAGDDRSSEAVRLFVARATAARPDFARGPETDAEIDRLCRALDGMPLAIELAAARVRVLSVAQIASRLDDRFRLLASGDRTAPPRQRTLRAAMDWSHALLGEPERVLFRRLAVFSGGWTLEMAERVCADDSALPESDVLDRLADLVDKSLLTVAGEVAGEMRYRMLESVREYATGHLDAAGEHDLMRDRHLAYVAGFAHAAYDAALGPSPRPWREVVRIRHRMAVEQGNTWAAMAWSLRTGDLEPGLTICHALIRGRWVPQGEFAEGAHWCDRFLDATADAPGRDRARLLVGRAEIAFERNDNATAADYARRGLAACRESGEEHAPASALNILAMIDLYGGDAGSARDRLAEALTLARDTGNRWDHVLALAAGGTVTLMSGDLEGARAGFGSALGVARDVGNNWLIGRTLLGLGAVAAAVGDRPGAVRLYEESLVLLREDDARTETTRCLLALARIAIGAGDHVAAADRLGEALRISEQAGHWRAVARCLEAAAGVAERLGTTEDAAVLCGAASRLREDIGAPPPTGVTFGALCDRLTTALGEARLRASWDHGGTLARPEVLARATRLLASTGAPAEPGAGPDGGDRPADPCDGAIRTDGPPGGAGRPVGGPGGALTAREVEIAGLLARGLSNRAIAGELVISPATAARHVANILTKLDFTSRAQVAAWAVRTGLAADGAEPGAH